jgi:hypothetical protein
MTMEMPVKKKKKKRAEKNKKRAIGARDRSQRADTRWA